MAGLQPRDNCNKDLIPYYDKWSELVVDRSKVWLAYNQETMQQRLDTIL